MTKKKVSRVKKNKNPERLKNLSPKDWFRDWHCRHIGIASYAGHPELEKVCNAFLERQTEEDVCNLFKKEMEKDGYKPKIWKTFTRNFEVEVKYQVNIANTAIDPTSIDFGFDAELYSFGDDDEGDDDENVRVLGVIEI